MSQKAKYTLIQIASIFVVMLSSALSSCVSYYKDDKRQYFSAVGTDATSITAGELNIVGLNQSRTTNKIVGGVVTRAALGIGGDLLQPTAEGAGKAISTIGQP